MQNIARAKIDRLRFSKSRLAVAARVAIETVEPRVLMSSIVYNYVTDQSVYDIGVSQTATVKVYLQESLNGNTSIIDGNGENGLLGAGFEVVSATRPTNPSVITAITPDTNDFGGAPSTHLSNSTGSNEATLIENISLSANTGVKTGNSGAPADEVYLGSLTIAGGAAAGTTTFDLGEYSVNGIAGGNTITNPDGYDLDISGSVHGVSYTGVGTTLTTFSVVTSSSSLPSPTVTVTSGNIVYNGSAYQPSATVTGGSGADAGAGVTYTYYTGSAATGTPLSGAPSSAGTYTVVGNFAGDSTYSASSSLATNFQITPLAITGNITADSKTYDGTTAATIATRTLLGVINGDMVSYVGGAATFANSGPGANIMVTATGLSLSGADSGNYTVNTSATTTADVFSTTLPTPTVTVTSGNSVYTGNAYQPSATITGSSGVDSSATLTYTYYAGSTGTGTPLPAAPSTVGTYTVVANFAGDSTYGPTSSAPATFQVTPASPLVPTLGNVVLPTTAVAGVKLTAKVPVVITNSSGSIKGKTTFKLFSNTGTSLDGNQVLVASLTKNLSLPAGKSKDIVFNINSLPSTLMSGTYHLFVEVVDSNGLTNIVATTQTIQVAAPVIQPEISLAAVIPSSIAVGKFGSILVTVSNAGNVAARGVSITLSPSTDGVTALPGVNFQTLRRGGKIAPGASKTFKLRFRVTRALAAGSYYPYVSLTLGGMSDISVGTTQFSVE